MEREERINKLYFALRSWLKFLLKNASQPAKEYVFMKIYNETRDVLCNSTSKGYDTARWKRVGWENTARSRNQSD